MDLWGRRYQLVGNVEVAALVSPDDGSAVCGAARAGLAAYLDAHPIHTGDLLVLVRPGSERFVLMDREAPVPMSAEMVFGWLEAEVARFGDRLLVLREAP